MNKVMQELSWVGSQKDFVDKITIVSIAHVVLGRFGGNSTAGQYKNEDGCIIWVNEKFDYEFVVLLDAHQTAESAKLVVTTINNMKNEIIDILTRPVNESFNELSQLLLSTFQSESFKHACKSVQGETAFLCAVRKSKYLWWFSVGDCLLHVNHPELSALHEYQQNHRSFYEWIGRVNTFELEVPCYSTGRKELRKGRNHLFLTTDGLTECPNTNFDNPKEIFSTFENRSNEDSVRNLLETIQAKNVRDSTTILSWYVDVEVEASQPVD
jgi:serine/threonine protein phosphatase PrpC